MLKEENKTNHREFEFTHHDFSRIRKLIYQYAGISLSAAKADMVYSRMGRCLRRLNLHTFKIYLDNLESENNPAEREAFVNALTTNHTYFFREEHHFPMLAAHLSKLTSPIRIWCCAASTGEEPYTIAITACEVFGSMSPPVEIVATDIDTNVLTAALRGVYSSDRVSKLSDYRLKHFFQRGVGKHAGTVRVRNELKQMVSFEALNLSADSWQLKEPFDVIFCRNVMIYFDKPTQSKILSRFAPLMKSNGLLFAGHSENLMCLSDAFKLRGGAVYELNRGHRAAINSPRINKVS